MPNNVESHHLLLLQVLDMTILERKEPLELLSQMFNINRFPAKHIEHWQSRSRRKTSAPIMDHDISTQVLCRYLVHTARSIGCVTQHEHQHIGTKARPEATTDL